MGAMASQITSLAIVYSTVYQAQIKENIKTPHHWPLCGNSPVNSPHKWPVTRKMFPFDDVIMWVCGINDSFLWKDLKYLSGCVISVLRDDIKYHCIFFCFINGIQQNNANVCTDLCIYLQIRSLFLIFLFFFLMNCIVRSGVVITRSNIIWFLYTRHFQMHFYERKVSYFDSNFTEVCS